MDLNQKYKNTLQKSINYTLLELGELSFEQMLEDEILLLEDKSEIQKHLISVLENKNIIKELNSLTKTLEKRDIKFFKEKIKRKITKILNEINIKNNNYSLNLLFLEWDEIKGELNKYALTLSGYDDANFKQEIQEGIWIDFDSSKELFNGLGEIDFSEWMNPLLKIQEELGEEIYNSLKLAFEEEMTDIRHLYTIGFSRLMHEIFSESARELPLNKNVFLKENVFIYINEHDNGEIPIYHFENK